jgi:hypothetical protein
MAVAFHRRDQIGQDRSEAFPTDAIGGLPEDDERLADRVRVDPPRRGGRLVDDGIDRGEDSNCVLAMAAGDGNEFIQDFCLLGFRCMCIAFMEDFEEFVLGLLADLGMHAVAPEVGNIRVRQQSSFGSRIGESMRCFRR